MTGAYYFFIKLRERESDLKKHYTEYIHTITVIYYLLFIKINYIGG